jgi:hypothetical protein
MKIETYTGKEVSGKDHSFSMSDVVRSSLNGQDEVLVQLKPRRDSKLILLRKGEKVEELGPCVTLSPEEGNRYHSNIGN